MNGLTYVGSLHFSYMFCFAQADKAAKENKLPGMTKKSAEAEFWSQFSVEGRTRCHRAVSPMMPGLTTFTLMGLRSTESALARASIAPLTAAA